MKNKTRITMIEYGVCALVGGLIGVVAGLYDWCWWVIIFVVACYVVGYTLGSFATGLTIINEHSNSFSRGWDAGYECGKEQYDNHR